MTPNPAVPVGMDWWREIERYPGKGDGLDVVVEVCEMPARFYRVRALDGTNSMGEPVDGFVLATGSGGGMRNLAITIAWAIAGGMLTLDRPEEQ